jgi:hypothetical protein
MSQTKKCLKLRKMSQTKKNVSNYWKMFQTILLLYFEAMYEESSLSSETMIISMHMSISYSYSSSFLLYLGNRQ